jgi:hypothetical protein
MSDFLDLHDDPSVRRVLYLGATLLVAVPFLQAGSQLWPLQLSNIQWRFGAANALSSVLLLPFLGMSLLVLMSRALDSRALARTVGVIATLFTLGLLGSLALFALDALQLKKIVNSAMMNTFNTTAVRVGLVTTLFLVAFALMALACFKTPRGNSAASAKKGDKKAEEGVGLIVGR